MNLHAPAVIVRDRIVCQQDAQAAGQSPVFPSVIALGELRFAVEVCADPAEPLQRAAYLRQVEDRPILDVTSNTAAAVGVLAAAIKRSGRSPRPRYNDLWSGAQAIGHGYTLLTLNPTGFAGLSGLRILALAPQRIEALRSRNSGRT